MLVLIGVDFLFLVKTEQFFAFRIRDRCIISADDTFGTDQHFIHTADSAGYMTALAVQYRAIGIYKFYVVVIKNLSILFSFSYLAAAHSLCFYRIASFEPVHHINIVNMLFGNMITAKPVKIIPVAH